jgi:omega-hydroxy-beta-dihydromenaquinone-9 sulfotransferase
MSTLPGSPLPKPPFRLPQAHFMALAPLDVWWRILRARGAPLRARFWPSILVNLFTSTLGTALTLPERLLLSPLWRSRARAAIQGTRPLHEPGFVFVLGYYRSGTTHLHYLLSCDPQFRTPAWCQCLAPSGFVLSWAFLRLFLIPFISGKRPQDDVAIGPDWPAEDDFALNNLAAVSPLVGRFVRPSTRFGSGQERARAGFQLFHDLQGLTPRELDRWRHAWLGFLARLSVQAGSRQILLKTPAHTARVGEILRLLGPERCRFIMISRPDDDVIKSNVAMQKRLEPYLLEPMHEAEDIERAIREEYAGTMDRFETDAPLIPPGRLCRVRFEDLTTDAEGTLDRIYRDLGLSRSAEAISRASAYQESVRGYTPAHGSARTPLAIAPGADGGGVGARSDVAGSVAARSARGSSTARGAIAAAFVALLALMLWLLAAWVLKTRADWLVWPAGVGIGAAALHFARAGAVRLGVIAAVLAVLTYVLVVLPATFLSDYGQRPGYFARAGEPRALGGLSPWIPAEQWEWYHIKKSTTDGVLAWNNLFWIFMGVASAYRFASREHARPPGR